MSNPLDKILNVIEVDEFGRTHGLIAVNKPAGITSHDVVDQVRRKLKTKRVGHAGALDPFATGVLLILVGKFTKLSEKLIMENKEYKARILFGIATNTQDPDGEVIVSKEVKMVESKVKSALLSFEGGYEQYVPVFSSVKVEGNKLRELARNSESFEIIKSDAGRKVIFKMKNKMVEVEIPRRPVKVENIRVLEQGMISSHDLPFKAEKIKELHYVDVLMNVSKGTYIRQFAEDLGEVLGVPAMLLTLERTKVGQVDIKDAIKVEELSLDQLPPDEAHNNAANFN